MTIKSLSISNIDGSIDTEKMKIIFQMYTYLTTKSKINVYQGKRQQ